jgi:hypothetical protein
MFNNIKYEFVIDKLHNEYNFLPNLNNEIFIVTLSKLYCLCIDISLVNLF